MQFGEVLDISDDIEDEQEIEFLEQSNEMNQDLNLAESLVKEVEKPKGKSPVVVHK